MSDDVIKAQAAQIEGLQRAMALVQSAAKAVVASSDERLKNMAVKLDAAIAGSADVAGERAANAALTEENERLRAQIEALTKDAERFRALGVSELQLHMYGYDPLQWMASWTDYPDGRPRRVFAGNGAKYDTTTDAVDAAVSEMVKAKAK